MYGYVPTGRNWDTQLEISGLDAPAVDFKLDAALPAIGRDPKFPTDLVVIPRGRLVGPKAQGITSGSPSIASGAPTATDTTQSGVHQTILTLATPDDPSANGANKVRPAGFAGYAMFKEYHADKAQWKPAVFKNRLIQLPYIVGGDGFNNSVFGNLKNGDYIMAYPGYTGYSTYTAADPRHVGKPVKWIGRKVYAWTGTAASTAALAYGLYSPFKPRVISAFTSAGAVAAIGSISWVAGTGWVSVGSGATSAQITTILYDYGVDQEDMAGQVLSTELLDSDMPGWLKWVQDNYGVWDLPRIQIPGLTLTAGATSGTSLVAVTDNSWRITPTFGTQIATYKPFLIKFTSDVEYLDPTTGTYVTLTAGSYLPRIAWQQNLSMGDYGNGYNYSYNPLTNLLTIWGVRVAADDSALTNTIIQTSYYEETVADGRGYANGQMGITDGMGGSTGAYAGIPRELDVTGGVGILRAMIF